MTSLLIALMLSQSSVIVQQGRARDGGIAWPVSLMSSGSYEQPVTFNDYTKSAFGAIRTASPYELADITFTHEINANIWGQNLDGGSVTWLPNESAMRVDGPYAQARTHSQFRYQPGRGQRVVESIYLLSALDAGVARWGLYDDKDGLFWQTDSRGLGFVIRSSTDGGVTETWRAVDAGVGWVPSNGNIYETRFQWLGVGRVIGYVNEIEAARIENVNRSPVPYTKTAMLPLSVDAVGVGVSVKMGCASVTSEGGEPPTIFPFSNSRSADLVISGNSATFVPVLTLRPAMTYNGQTSRIALVPTALWCLADSKRIRVKVVVQPAVLTGAVFGSVSTASAAEVDETATAVSGGIEILSFAVPANGYFEQEVTGVFGETKRRLHRRAFSVYDGGTSLDIAAMNTLNIQANNPGAGNATVNCGIEWQEIR